MQAIFDYILTQLNASSTNVYEGNYIFKMFDDKLQIISEVDNKLVNELVDIVPVSVLTKVPVPFVENNHRIDWLLELGFVIRIPGKEYDVTTDLDYANIKSVFDALQGTVLTISGKRYAFKTQEPDYIGWSFLERSKVATIVAKVNVTQIDFGYFGNDSVWVMGGKTLDVVSVSRTATRRYYTASKVNDTDNDYNVANGRSVIIELTFNYKDESDLLSEVTGKQTLSKTYTLTETFNSGTPVSYTVSVESAIETQIKGGVKQITLRCVEA